jgi:mono/diheme cytochrome c family protein
MKRMQVRWLAWCCLVLAGCERASQPEFVAAPQLAELDKPLQQAIARELSARCGTPDAPKLLGSDDASAEELKHGAAVYARQCRACHGVSGDGAGPAADYLSPRPRDYRRGIFKFTSTPYGNKPRREDLLRTVTRGIPGTSMPSFRRMPKRDLEAVVDYVLALTHRGELEFQLAAQAESEGEVTAQMASEAADTILERWRDAGREVVEPASKMPAFSDESVAAGAAAFQKRECFKCHGRDGRGGIAGGIEVGNDAWGHKDPAADLTSGMLRGGQKPLDIYRRISAGINGTPMPAFKDVFTAEPDTIWQLAHYVMRLSDQRRRGVQFAPGHEQTQPAADPAATKADTPDAEASP